MGSRSNFQGNGPFQEAVMRHNHILVNGKGSKKVRYRTATETKRGVVIIDDNDIIDIKLFVETVTLLTDKISQLTAEIEVLKRDNTNVASELEALKTIIQPDKEDVYNINRRIDILAHRIATQKNETSNRGIWRTLTEWAKV